MDNIIVFSYLIAALTGAIVGCVDLSSKFNDSVCKILRSGGSWFYLAVNVVTAVIAYYIAVTFDIKISNIGIQDNPFIGSFITGLVSMGILRTSLFSLSDKRNKHNINAAIGKLLSFAEKSYDRNKNKYLMKNVPPVVRGISFDDLCKDIVQSCMSGLTYPDYEDSKKINSIIKKLKSEGIDSSEETKAENLAIEVAKIVGIDILKQGVLNFKENENFRAKKTLQYHNIIEDLQKTIKKGIDHTGRDMIDSQEGRNEFK